MPSPLAAIEAKRCRTLSFGSASHTVMFNPSDQCSPVENRINEIEPALNPFLEGGCSTRDCESYDEDNVEGGPRNETV
jgi:hypothetical protein